LARLYSAVTGKLRQTKGVPAWSSFSYFFGPLVAFAGLGIMVLILRWAFARGGSVVERAPKSGNPDEYGMLVPIASPSNYIEGELLRRSLVDAGLRASLAQTNDGPRIMVWPKDVEVAKQVLKKAAG
jgi:hypothetical protein